MNFSDLSVGPDKLMKLNKGQKINHFHGMLAICRKKSLFCSLSTMRKYKPTSSSFTLSPLNTVHFTHTSHNIS